MRKDNPFFGNHAMIVKAAFKAAIQIPNHEYLITNTQYRSHD